ncbi:hypothetical protein GCM10020221_14960 [Streptomyces thioluteus]|uniref:Uncharacterized protein n=1 Tax=Streptomyces thioluteus TaxID=66431 RepID=A0ABN3WMK4_STRTU
MGKAVAFIACLALGAVCGYYGPLAFVDLVRTGSYGSALVDVVALAGFLAAAWIVQIRPSIVIPAGCLGIGAGI